MSAAAPRHVTIDIWSDVMCPWCVIGYRKLQQGLDLLGDEIAAEVRWHAFQLNPQMPTEGEDQAEHIMRKYGRTPEQAAAGRKQMAEMAAAAGYSFAYTGAGEPPPARLWNTFLAHKLLTHALAGYGPEGQTRLKLALFDAHFQQRRNVSDPAVLLDIAEAAGLDRARAEKAFANEALDDHVRAEQEQAWDMNISGVPAMVVNGKYLIPGAQEPDVYANAIRRVLEKEARAGASV